MLYVWNWHNIVNQLYFNSKKKKIHHCGNQWLSPTGGLQRLHRKKERKRLMDHQLSRRDTAVARWGNHRGRSHEPSVIHRGFGNCRCPYFDVLGEPLSLAICWWAQMTSNKQVLGMCAGGPDSTHSLKKTRAASRLSDKLLSPFWGKMTFRWSQPVFETSGSFLFMHSLGKLDKSLLCAGHWASQERWIGKPQSLSSYSHGCVFQNILAAWLSGQLFNLFKPQFSSL